MSSAAIQLCGGNSSSHCCGIFSITAIGKQAAFYQIYYLGLSHFHIRHGATPEKGSS
jgi:hypothetical protein